MQVLDHKQITRNSALPHQIREHCLGGGKREDQICYYAGLGEQGMYLMK